MATKSTIEWTEMTWNPVTGCTKVSHGCKNCYAERMAKRPKAMGAARYSKGFSLTLHYDLVELPKRWISPRTVFVNSMSDLFHKDVPEEFIQSVFRTMNDCPQHTFQILTKRSERLLELSRRLTWSPNIWMGVSVESAQMRHRIAHLRRVDAKVRFLSCEPLISSLEEIDLEGIHWVIVGGESGPHARPIEKRWVESIKDQCDSSGTSFFFKQWGGTRKKKTGRELNGRTYDNMPFTQASTLVQIQAVC